MKGDTCSIVMGDTGDLEMGEDRVGLEQKERELGTQIKIERRR